MSAERNRTVALAKGRKLKRSNAITALLFGAVPGLLFSRLIHPSPIGWTVGLLVGLLWANAFEYFYHRFLLHLPRSSFGREHLLHHSSVGTPDEPEHLPFGSSPLYLAGLFATNGLLAVAIGWLLHVTVSPGILTGFSVYLIMVEEIHWRIHMGEWLPLGIEWAREYHMAHHDIASGRFNVFFPVFDYLFGNVRPEIANTEAHIMAQAALNANPQELRLSSLEAALLWSWMAVIAIGVRYFWNTGPKG
jgi:Fatty acid hydroxylase superfamily